MVRSEIQQKTTLASDKSTEQPGVSILIPIYNFTVTDLVKNLTAQAKKLDIAIEIRCYDDHSSDLFKKRNNEIATNPYVVYRKLLINLGRSKIRNLMAKEARYNWLLFIDCDSGVESETFLEDYLKHQDSQVVIGGRRYQEKPPHNDDYMLHWLVGKTKEEKAASVRTKKPYDSFMFNNVFIRKSVFLDIMLDESITTYGHEDTKFGYTLKERKIPVKHIDNPVIHIGLDKKEQFLEKTQHAINNIYNIYKKEGYGSDTKLIKTSKLLKGLGLSKLFLLYYKLNQSKIEENLLSSEPKVKNFDLYKLKLFLEKK
ncbi:MAG TPA: glycosyltransferase family 2 protein [Cytophagaceae bacterium]